MRKVTVYRMVIEVLDFENQIPIDVVESVQRNKNLSIHLHEAKMKEISDWSDEHPLNKFGTKHQAFLDLFKD